MKLAFSNIKTIEDIKRFERISTRVSSKYVPIYTSNLVESLSEGFSIISGSIYRYTSNAHYIVLGSNKNDKLKLYIDNSFDRTVALRISFMYKNLIFGFIKQVHMGESASDISHNYDSVSELYIKASSFIDTLSKYQLDEEDRQVIVEQLFKERGIPLNRVVEESIFKFKESETTLEYFDRIIGLLMSGEFQINSTKGIKLARASKSQFLKISMNKRIYTYLTKHNPELAI